MVFDSGYVLTDLSSRITCFVLRMNSDFLSDKKRFESRLIELREPRVNHGKSFSQTNHGSACTTDFSLLV